MTQRVAGYDEPKQIRVLKKGDYFGEKALLRYCCGNRFWHCFRSALMVSALLYENKSSDLSASNTSRNQAYSGAK